MHGGHGGGHGGQGGGHDFHEEAALGNIYDARLVRKLLGLVRPYWPLMALAVAVLLAVTAFDLVLPYLTKEVIDRYITKTGRVATVEAPVPGSVPLAGDTVLMDQARLPKDQQHIIAQLERRGRLLPGRYYYFYIASAPNRPAAQAVVNAHPDVFKIYGGTVLAQYPDLAKLTKQEVAVVRARDLSGPRSRP